MNVFFDMVGCRVNQAELDSLAADFVSRGCVLVPSACEADLIVINTCTVTREAERDSRQKARQARRENPTAGIALTGCWVTQDESSARRLAENGWCIPNIEKDRLPDILLGQAAASAQLETRASATGKRRRTRAYIKAQDGCNNHCTYCITRLVRGPARSRPAQSVLADIFAAERSGAQETVLAGISLGSWGADFEQPETLESLLRTVLARTSIPRIRISSLEPWNLSASLFDAWSDPRLCPHLHLPLQSGSADILRRMGRNTSPDSFAALVAEARAAIADLAVTTDVIVGFPGETEIDFLKSMDFIRSLEFARLHVFSFSPRPGTIAEGFGGRVPREAIRERARAMRTLGAQLQQNFLKRYAGQRRQVLWEARRSDGSQHGLTANYLSVSAPYSAKFENRIIWTVLSDPEGDGFSGVPLGIQSSRKNEVTATD